VLGTEVYQNPTNYNDSRGNLNNVRRHVLVASYVYDLPFGKGRPLLSNVSGVANGIVGGWQISGLIQGMSGLPYSPTFDTSVQGSPTGAPYRPNVVAGAPLYPSNRTIAQYFNPAAFVAPPSFTYGNAGYNLLWGPGQQSWDMGLSKQIPMFERIRMELRLDAFSVFNHPEFGGSSALNVDISNTAAVGRITAASGNRTVQLGAKLTF